jgi:hypothetical protein
VTHARQLDPELAAEARRGRLVTTGDSFDPTAIELSVDGGPGRRPSALHTWPQRYPWWRTVEPIYRVDLAPGQREVSVSFRGPDGRLGAERYRFEP